MNLEQLGLLGIFIAGAVPWLEAIAFIPPGIAVGFDPVLTVIAAVAGNASTIFLFAYSGSGIRNWLRKRREAKGKTGESPKYQKALVAFQKYGFWGMAALGPIIIGSQFAAAASVAAGVKPMKTSIFISVSVLIWSVALAWVMVALGVKIV
jgi:hypothetical protein